MYVCHAVVLVVGMMVYVEGENSIVTVMRSLC